MIDEAYRMVFHHYGFARDFSMHPIDGIAFHRCDIRSVVHCDVSNDAGSRPIPSKMFCYNLCICTAVRPYGICGCDRSNRDEWWIFDCNHLLCTRMVWCLQWDMQWGIENSVFFIRWFLCVNRTFVEAEMLIQVTGLSVPFSTHFAQIRPSDRRRNQTLESSSFCVDGFHVRDQLTCICSEHLATFFTKEFILSGRWIRKVGQVLLWISISNEWQKLVGSIRNVSLKSIEMKWNETQSADNYLCSYKTASESNVSRHSLHMKRNLQPMLGFFSYIS